METVRARSWRSADLLSDSGSWPLMLIVPALTRPLRGRYLTSASATVDLPDPDSPTRPDLPAAGDEKDPPARGEPVLAPHPVHDVHVRDLQRGTRRRGRVAAHALSTCSIESVIRLTAVTSEAMASAGYSVCHQ